MALKTFELIRKINLTHDVYELEFKSDSICTMKAGQFITFLIDKIGGRAYSILKVNTNSIILIIKKRELENGWRWWSKYICELNIWDKLNWVWPAWHFLLKDNDKNKLFIWTGTWIVPLYNMISSALENKAKYNIHLTFWVRTEKDLFYIEELEKLKKDNENFDYHVYISRVKDLHEFKLNHPSKTICSGYTTNYITEKNIKDFWEVYICWAPAMIESTVEKLEKLWLKSWENIFYEKY